MKPSNRKGLTKADLVDVVYQRHGGLTKAEATAVVEAIFGAVKTTLGDGRPVKIKNFGTFEVTDRPGRLGVNPSSGEKMFIPPHKGLSFRPAQRLVRPAQRSGEARPKPGGSRAVDGRPSPIPRRTSS